MNKDEAVKEWCRVYDGEMTQVITDFVTSAMRGMKEAYLSGWEECARQHTKESPGTVSNSGSYEMPADIKEKFTEFVANQKGMPPEFAQVVNDNFWDLI